MPFHLAALLCLLTALASPIGFAQTQPAGPEAAPPSPPPPPPALVPEEAPAPAKATGVTLSEQKAAKAQRYSRFSAGPGGPLFIFSEVVAGLVTGGMIGRGDILGDARQHIYFGALAGGLLLGGAATAYQYSVPVGRMVAGLAALGGFVGALAGAGIATAAEMSSFFGVAWLVAAMTQVGFAVPLIATFGHEDISGEDLGLIGMTTLYAFVVTMLGLAIAQGGPGWLPLVSPAAGTLIGGLLATQVEMKPGRTLRLTALPLGIGLVLWFLGATTGNPQLASATALIGIGVTFGLTLLFTAEGPAPAASAKPARSRQEIALIPLPVVMAAGRKNQGVAAGPGLAVVF